MADDREVMRRHQPNAAIERQIGIGTSGVPECCDYCASPRLEWRKCKLICMDSTAASRNPMSGLSGVGYNFTERVRKVHP